MWFIFVELHVSIHTFILIYICIWWKITSPLPWTLEKLGLQPEQFNKSLWALGYHSGLLKVYGAEPRSISCLPTSFTSSDAKQCSISLFWISLIHPSGMPLLLPESCLWLLFFRALKERKCSNKKVKIVHGSLEEDRKLTKH